MEARRASGAPSVYEAEDVSLHDFDGDAPVVRYRNGGATHELACDFIAGCDGFHGVCRAERPGGRDPQLRARLPVRLARPARRHAAGLATS